MPALENIVKLYNDEITLIFEPKKHTYTIDGEFVTGVTGAIGVIDKPALMYWAVNKCVEHLKGVWEAGESYDEVEIDQMLGDAKYAHRVRKEYAAGIGTMVHEWVEKWIKGENPKPPVNEMMLNATKLFLKWVKDNDVEFLHSERKVYSKKYNYAGTCDFVAKIGGKMIVGDIKTSTGIYDEYFFQTAAYQQALMEEFPEYKFDSNVIIRTGKDGSFEIGESVQFKENIKAFLGALAIYNRQQELKTKKMGK